MQPAWFLAGQVLNCGSRECNVISQNTFKTCLVDVQTRNCVLSYSTFKAIFSGFASQSSL